MFRVSSTTPCKDCVHELRKIYEKVQTLKGKSTKEGLMAVLHAEVLIKRFCFLKEDIKICSMQCRRVISTSKEFIHILSMAVKKLRMCRSLRKEAESMLSNQTLNKILYDMSHVRDMFSMIMQIIIISSYNKQRHFTFNQGSKQITWYNNNIKNH